MAYTISSLRVKNFKCFDNKKFYSFYFDKNKKPLILSGPNGFGKTTFFDAIELIFTKNITRLKKTIEHGNTDLKKNLLINEGDKDAYLVLELINDNNDYITIIANIDHSIKKLNFEDSLKFSIIKDSIDIETFDEYIDNITEWENSVKDFNILNFSNEHYNVFYYVSQEESVHFLKNSINKRKDSMNVLLNTDSIDRNINYLEEELIGRSQRKSGVLLNEEIKTLENNIKGEIEELKLKLNEDESKVDEISYEILLNYPEDIDLFNWDKKNYSSLKKTKRALDNDIEKITGFHKFIVNKSDFDNYLYNKKIYNYVNNNTILDDAEEFIKHFKNDNIKIIKIEKLIENWKRISEIYRYSKFFRNDLKIAIYNEDDLKKLNDVDSDLISVEINEITKLVDSIKKVQKELSEREKILNNLNNSRSRLDKVRKEFDEDSSNCPYCNHPYVKVEKLESAYNELTELLNSKKSIQSKKIQELISELRNKIEVDYKKIMSILENIDKENIQVINKKILKYQNFIESNDRIDAVKKVYTILKKSKDIDNESIDYSKDEIKNILSESIRPYEKIDFKKNLKTYEFEKIYKNNKNLFIIKQPRLADEECVKQKIDYLKYQYNLSKNESINNLKNNLKEKIFKLKKIESARGKMDGLRTMYHNAIDDYKNHILNKLRVPLLIYTGKILQDHQNGLGVFVSKKEMRFVSSGDAKHDVLNTFSSGQLSGFVLAFLFSMNRQYITNDDDIGFILIDDPVQTMDDINIGSLIEVLRNDFASKQIILSTHESDKENYILYKFLKYNLRGQSFNVKNELYA